MSETTKDLLWVLIYILAAAGLCVLLSFLFASNVPWGLHL